MLFEVDDPGEVAAQLIRDYCGWHVAPVLEESIILDGNGEGRILLPSRRVLNVSEVRVHGDVLAPTEFEWSQDGMLKRVGGVWPDSYRSVQVTLEHGFDYAGVLADVARAIVARMEADPTGVIASQRAGTQSVSFRSGAFGGGGGGGLLSTERELLAPYKLTWGP
ncbi:MAG: hypothetical protein E6719_02475 [Dermabacter sp.]|nr:hypothetical protein [Dermabacter sp.]